MRSSSRARRTWVIKITPRPIPNVSLASASHSRLFLLPCPHRPTDRPPPPHACIGCFSPFPPVRLSRKRRTKLQQANGGVLSVSEGGAAEFNGPATFRDNSVQVKIEGGRTDHKREAFSWGPRTKQGHQAASLKPRANKSIHTYVHVAATCSLSLSLSLSLPHEYSVRRPPFAFPSPSRRRLLLLLPSQS